MSILLTSYNHEQYVEKALESVAAQTFQDFELIITDDCSPDGSADRIAHWLERTGFPARFIRNRQNVGICAVRNRALAAARGSYLCSLSGDDWYEPHRLEYQHSFFESLPEIVAFIYSDVNYCDADGTPVEPTFLGRFLGPDGTPPDQGVFERLLKGNFIPAMGVMIRRSALDAVGGYDESLVFEDYDMWLRLSHRYEVRFLPGVVANYRVLPTSMSHSSDTARAMKASEMRFLSRWVGDPVADEILAARLPILAGQLRRSSIRLARRDRAAARRALHAARHMPPRWRWRAAETLLFLPGSARVLDLVAFIRQRQRST